MTTGYAIYIVMLAAGMSVTYYALRMVRLHQSNPRYGEQLIADAKEYAVVDNMIKHVAITADARKKITIELVGVEYEITPPKAIVGLKIAVRAKQAADGDPAQMLDAVNEWITRAFGKVEARAVQKRLDSDDDDLDFPHIMKLMEAVIEATTGNPTSSP